MNDRMKPVSLPKHQCIAIAEQTHAEFLRQIMLNTEVDARDLVFHGGTSLRMIHKSPRFSEDLYFMVSHRIIPELESILPRTVSLVELSMQNEHPHMSIRWKHKIKPDTSMLIGMMTMTSPLWHQSIKVKVECYPAHDMSHYISSEMEISNVEDIVIPTAVLDSIMGDKMVAIAKRPYFKERDAYDLWWLTKKGVVPTRECIERTCAIYGYDIDDVLSRLSSVSERIGSVEELQNGLKQWLPDELHNHFCQRNIFEDIRECTICLSEQWGMSPS